MRSAASMRHRGDVPVGVDAIEPERHQSPCRLVEFGGKLDAGGAGADDDDLHPARLLRVGLILGADAGIHQPTMKSGRLFGCF